MKSNLIGRRFGKLIVLEDGGRDSIQNILWLCQCDCGNKTLVRTPMLNSGRTKSCGCYREEVQRNRLETHGGRNSRLYRTWTNMKSRCFNSNTKSYQNYGARGITVCDEWLNDFQAFYEWSIKNGYSDELTLDRKNTYGNYEPNNCRWATAKQQQNNKRNNHIIEFEGETHTISEWAEIKGISARKIADRIRIGLSGKDIFDNKDRRFKKFPDDSEVEV